MPQIQVLPAVDTFGSQLAQVLGKAGSDIGQGLVQRSVNKNNASMLDQLKNPNLSPMQKISVATKLAQSLPADQAKTVLPFYAPFIFNQGFGGGQQAGSSAGADGSPQTPTESSGANSQANPQQNRKEFARSMVDNPYFGKQAEQELKDIRNEEKLSAEKSRDIFKINEPKLIELSDGLRDLELEDTRLSRLEQLYSDPSKFPNPTLASIFSREGQINPIAASLLSPEAQESIKLTIDSLSGAQSLFGGKVSNFEAQTYLKRNATLFNTPEGRARILDDLKQINGMKRKYAQGILEIIDEKGGSDKISLSSAERIWRQRNKKELEDLNNRFVHPEKGLMSKMPDASKYKGRKLQNDSTGEIFISDGTEWKKFKE